jgi:TIR domain
MRAHPGRVITRFESTKLFSSCFELDALCRINRSDTYRQSRATVLVMNTPVVSPHKTVRVFLSFADKDRGAAEDLWRNLDSALRVSANLRWELWSFTAQLLVGDDFDTEIRAALADADLGIFALSNSFLASEYISRVELPPFLSPGAGKRIAPVALKAIAADADLRGLGNRQIFGYREPYWVGRAPHAREAWANNLAAELHRIARRDGLGS